MSHPSPLKILLIDDCAESRYLYRLFLNEDNLYSYRIFELETLKKAMEWCHQEAPDLILLSVVETDGEGWKFIKYLREKLNNSKTIVLVLNAQEDEITTNIALQKGAQDCLPKSKLTQKALQRSIHNAVERAHLTQQLEKSRELQLIGSIALKIRQSLRLDEILNTATIEVRQFLKADRVFVYKFSSNMIGTVVAESVLPKWASALGVYIEDNFWGMGMDEKYRRGEKHAFDDVSQAQLTEFHLQLLKKFEVKANLIVPILVGDRLWGLLIAHQCRTPRHWQAGEIDVLEQLGVQIAIAIQQATAYEQIEIELAERKRTQAALKASEEELQFTFDFTHIGYWEWDISNNLVSGNEHFFHCLGYEASDTWASLKEQSWKLVHPEDQEFLESKVNGALANKTDYDIEYRVIWEDGSLHWLAEKGRGIYDDKTGNPLRMLGVVMDISDRKQIEETLRRNDERLHMALEAAGMGNWDWNLQTGQIKWSGSLESLFGTPLGSFNGNYKSVLEIVHPGDRDKFLQAIDCAITYQEDLNIEFRFTKSNGTLGWALARGKAFYDNKGKPTQMMGVGLDISDRKQVETERLRAKMLKAELELLEGILETAQAGYWDWNISNNTGYFSPSFKRMFGYNEEELTNNIADNWHILFFPEDLKGFDRYFQESIRENKSGSFHQELRYRHKNGSSVWCICSSRVIEWDEEGKPIRLVGCNFNISDRKQAESALQESERRYATLAKAAPVTILQFDANGYCTYANDRWSQMTGRPVQEALGMKWLDAFLSENREHIRIHPSAWEELDNIQEELYYIDNGNHQNQNGYANWVYIQVVPETNADGVITGYIGTMTDITQRKTTEQQLRKLSERLTIAIKSGGFGIWEWDIANDVLIWDERMYELYGIKTSEFEGASISWVNAIHPDDRTAAMALSEQARLGNVEYDTEFRIVHPDGNVRYIKAYALVDRYANGMAQRMVGVNYDITDIKQAQQELEESQTMLRLVLDTIPQRVFWKDRSLRYLGCNPAFARDTQLKPNQIIGKTDFELDWIKSANLYRGDDAQVIESQTPKLGYEEPMESISGGKLWLRTNKVPLTNSAGEVIGVLGSYEDITARKLAEEQLRLTNEELANTNAELARATRLKDEFLANMSHELRTPLNAILGMSEGLQENVFGQVNSRQAKAIATIERSGKHLLELINDILDLSKIEAGKLELQLGDVGVRNLCDSSLVFVRQMALKKNINLNTNICGDIRNFQADERRLRQVLINLLSNAIKFTPEAGTVELKIWQDPTPLFSPTQVLEVEKSNPKIPSNLPQIYFSVTDTGIGIGTEDIQKLFQPFIQLDSNLNRQYNGTGLGLALAKRIIDLHQGTVDVYSEIGQGSCFTVTIPYVSNDISIKSASTYKLPSENARILIVEDSQLVCEQISRYLSELGMEAIVNPQGEGTLEKVMRFQPAIIFLDLQLPNMSGWEVLAQLKAEPQTKDIPVVILSVMDEQAQGLAKGAAAYLVKPITRIQVRETLEKLQNPANSESNILASLPEKSVQPPLILLAEDNQANIETMSAYLEVRGYGLLLAKNGQEAVEIALAQKPKLIVMDIQMPVMDGLEAMRSIRQNQDLNNVPIIALTALAMSGDRKTCLAAGANEYLTKPVKLKQLVTTIQTLLAEVEGNN